MPTAPSPFTLRAALRRQWVLVLALPLLVVIVGIGAAGHVPLAGGLLGGLLVVLALLRAVLPTSRVGALAVRPKAIDVSVMLVLALGLLLLVWAPNL